MESQARSRWKKVLWIGCGIASVMLVIVVVLVALNWSSISSFVGETRRTLAALGTVQEKVLEVFPATQVQAKAKSTTGVEGRILVVEVVNSPDFHHVDLAGPEGLALAHDVACTARAALPDGVSFAHVEILFVRSAKLGVTFSKAKAYAFPWDRLASPPDLFRSGTIEDDTLGGPIEDRARKYAPALATANRCLEALQAGNTKQIHAALSDEFRAKSTEQQCTDLIRQANERYGPIRSFEPTQWKFAARTIDGRRRLACAKVVRHERAALNWTFVFDEGGPYQELIGFQWWTRPDESSTDAKR